MRRAVLTSALAACVVLAGSEWLERRWSRMLVHPPRPGTEAVVVLGFRNAGPRANLVNRHRVHIGLRSQVGDSTLVLSGGAPAGGPPEAQVMAEHARELGYAGPLILEENSRSTWENVTNVIPLIERFDRIRIASHPAHALKARDYLRRLRPDLAARVAPADDHHPGEWLLLKPLAALYGLWALRGVGDVSGAGRTASSR